MTEHNHKNKQFQLLKIITLSLLAYVIGTEIIQQIP